VQGDRARKIGSEARGYKFGSRMSCNVEDLKSLPECQRLNLVRRKLWVVSGMGSGGDGEDVQGSIIARMQVNTLLRV
jgi:hypothetical protein